MTSTLGDAIQKISISIYLEIDKLLGLMQNQDPELRTLEFRTFIHRSRKKLLQLFALIRWLSMPGVSDCFRSVSNYNSQVSTIDDGTARSLDEVYFTHAGIFSMRSRPFEISRAIDVLTRKTYYNLPSTMFSCGKPSFPAKLDENLTVKDLNIFLRSKVYMVDRLPTCYPIGAVIADGILTITYSHYFELFLTLVTLDEDADWRVLGCRLFIEQPLFNINGDLMTTDYDVSYVERGLVDCLRNLIADKERRDKVAVVADDQTVNEDNKSELLIAPDAASISDEVPRLLLYRMINICRHAAIATNLRLLYAQTLPVDGTTAVIPSLSSWYMGIIASRFEETSDCTYLSVKYWKSQFHEDYQFELRISQQRSCSHRKTVEVITDSNNSGDLSYVSNGLTVEIYTRLTALQNNQHLIFSNDSRIFTVPGISSVLNGESYISSGPNAAALLQDTLCLTSQWKLRVLYQRLQYTLQQSSTISDSKYGVNFEVTLKHAQIVLSRKPSTETCTWKKKVIIISVDARNGKYLLDSSGLTNVVELGRREFDLFVTEINNLDAEDYVSNYVLKHGGVLTTYTRNNLASNSINSDNNFNNNNSTAAGGGGSNGVEPLNGSSVQRNNQFASLLLPSLIITTLEDVTKFLELAYLSDYITATTTTAAAAVITNTSSTLSPLSKQSVAYNLLLQPLGLSRCKALVFSINYWLDYDTTINKQQDCYYSALFPYSAVDVVDNKDSVSDTFSSSSFDIILKQYLIDMIPKKTASNATEKGNKKRSFSSLSTGTSSSNIKQVFLPAAATAAATGTAKSSNNNSNNYNAASTDLDDSMKQRSLKQCKSLFVLHVIVAMDTDWTVSTYCTLSKLDLLSTTASLVGNKNKPILQILHKQVLHRNLTPLAGHETVMMRTLQSSLSEAETWCNNKLRITARHFFASNGVSDVLSVQQHGGDNTSSDDNCCTVFTTNSNNNMEICLNIGKNSISRICATGTDYSNDFIFAKLTIATVHKPNNHSNVHHDALQSMTASAEEECTTVIGCVGISCDDSIVASRKQPQQLTSSEASRFTTSKIECEVFARKLVQVVLDSDINSNYKRSASKDEVESVCSAASLSKCFVILYPMLFILWSSVVLLSQPNSNEQQLQHIRLRPLHCFSTKNINKEEEAAEEYSASVVFAVEEDSINNTTISTTTAAAAQTLSPPPTQQQQQSWSKLHGYLLVEIVRRRKHITTTLTSNNNSDAAGGAGDQDAYCCSIVIRDASNSDRFYRVFTPTQLLLLEKQYASCEYRSLMEKIAREYIVQK